MATQFSHLHIYQIYVVSYQSMWFPNRSDIILKAQAAFHWSSCAQDLA